MPKLQDFSNHIKIDGNGYAKDSINYQINENSLLLYHERNGQQIPIVSAPYGEYTNKNDEIYVNMATLVADLDVFLFRVPLDAQDEISRGLVDGASQFNKFGYREGLTSAGGEQTIWAATGNFTIETSPSTYTVTYTNSSDGAGTTGALSLLISYMKEDYTLAESVHVLGSSGSDVTNFEGIGINRVVVFSSGSQNTNDADITITQTTGGSIQATVPARGSVTQQCIFHVPINHTAPAKWLWINVNKLSGGSAPKVTVKGYVYNRFVQTTYEVFRMTIDTDVENTITVHDPCNFVLGGRDVLYFVADTDTNSTVVTMRFSLNLYLND